MKYEAKRHRAKVRPRDYLAPKQPDRFGDGNPSWVLQPGFLDLEPEQQQQPLWDLAAAVSQHHHVVTFAQARLDRDQGLAQKDLCTSWGYDWVRFGKVARGDTVMRHNDLTFMFRSLGTAALPAPTALRSAIDLAVQTAVASAGGLKSGLLAPWSREQVLVMDALGGGAGTTTIARALTEEEIEGNVRNQVASEPVHRAATRLRTRPGIGPADIARRLSGDALRLVQPEWSDLPERGEVSIELSRHECERATARGAADGGGFVVTVWLKHDWATEVFDCGWAELDGWFVAEVLGISGGRPSRVRVLDLIPHRGDTRRDKFGVYLADHDFSTREMPVEWAGDRPSLPWRPEDPSHP